MASLPAADPGLLFWLLAALHFAGLASMFLARLPQGKRGYAVGQRVFFTCLFVVGMAGETRKQQASGQAPVSYPAGHFLA